MDQNRLSLLALHFIPGIGNHLIKQLVSYCGSAEKVFKTPKGKLRKIPGIGDVSAELIGSGKPFLEAEQEAKRADKELVNLVFFTDPCYPSRLRQIHDSPSLLYTKGNINFENPKTKQYQEYSTAFSGLHQVIRPNGLYLSQQGFGMYRWHILDPIRFEKDLRITIQDLGWRSGGRYLPQQSDISSVVFWYQSEPHNNFGQLPSVNELEVN